MKKPTIYQVCVGYGIDLLRLHRESSVDPFLIWDLFREVPVPRQETGMVIQAINTLAHTHYTIQDLEIACTVTGAR